MPPPNASSIRTLEKRGRENSIRTVGRSWASSRSAASSSNGKAITIRPSIRRVTGKLAS